MHSLAVPPGPCARPCSGSTQAVDHRSQEEEEAPPPPAGAASLPAGSNGIHSSEQGQQPVNGQWAAQSGSNVKVMLSESAVQAMGGTGATGLPQRGRGWGRGVC